MVNLRENSVAIESRVYGMYTYMCMRYRIIHRHGNTAAAQNASLTCIEYYKPKIRE